MCFLSFFFLLYTLRGTGTFKKKPGCVVLEEAAYFDPRVLMPVIAPTLTRKNMSLICISTRASSYNFFDKLLDIVRNDGRPLFHTIIYEMVCEECKEKGEEIACMHLLGELPYWLSASQYQDVIKIMEDYSESVMAELMGEQKNPLEVRIFKTEYINYLSSAPRYRSIREDVVRIGVDPGNSNTADYSVVSTLRTKDGDLVVSEIFLFFYFDKTFSFVSPVFPFFTHFRPSSFPESHPEVMQNHLD